MRWGPCDSGVSMSLSGRVGVSTGVEGSCVPCVESLARSSRKGVGSILVG